MSDPGRWMQETRDFQREVHELAVSKGFWGVSDNFAEKIALIHSELSEALDADRKGEAAHIGEELADAVIRIMDLAEYLKIDLAKEIRYKHNRNRARPFLHGKRY